MRHCSAHNTPAGLCSRKNPKHPPSVSLLGFNTAGGDHCTRGRGGLTRVKPRQARNPRSSRARKSCNVKRTVIFYRTIFWKTCVYRVFVYKDESEWKNEGIFSRETFLATRHSFGIFVMFVWWPYVVRAQLVLSTTRSDSTSFFPKRIYSPYTNRNPSMTSPSQIKNWENLVSKNL